MTIIYNSNYDSNPNYYLTLAITAAARRVIGGNRVVLCDARTLLPEVATGRHDTLICIDGQRLEIGLLRRIRPALRTMILWLFEDPFMLDYNLERAPIFDHVFTNDPACVSRYGEAGSYLPLAASSDLHDCRVLEDSALEYDIFFAGTMWPNRTVVISALLDRFRGHRIKLVCPTNEFLPPLPRALAETAIKWPVSHSSFIGFANASRVTLTLFRDYASSGDLSRASAPGPRFFELGLAGAAQVIIVDSDQDVANFDVVDGPTLCTDIDSGFDAIERLIGDPGLRRDAAARAKVAVANAHLYEHRIQEMLTVVDQAAKPLVVATRPPRVVRVLMCTHSTIHEREWGGVEVYQQTLVEGLRPDYEFFYWMRKESTCFLVDESGAVLERFAVAPAGWLDLLNDAKEEMAFSKVLAAYAIDVVHVQHLGSHAMSLPIIAKASGLGVVYSMHDFFLVCSRYNLIDADHKFCRINEKTITACDVCLKVAEDVAPGCQGSRRSFMSEMIEAVDVFLFGTEHSKALAADIYPALNERELRVTGIPTPGEPPSSPRLRVVEPDRPLRVAIVGNFIRTKGAATVLRVIDLLDPQSYEFHIFGKASDEYLSVLAPPGITNVVYHGRYGPGELGVLESCEVALHLSTWPETFCITLSEVWQRGLVPIVGRLGALGDRVTHGVNGFVVEESDVSAVVGHLSSLRGDPALLASVRQAISPALWVDRASHLAEIADVYRKLTPHRAFAASPWELDVGRLHYLPHRSWRQLAAPRHIFDPPIGSQVKFEPDLKSRSLVEDDSSRFYIDRINGVEVALNCDSSVENLFESNHELRIDGWCFTGSFGVAGQVEVGMLGMHDAPSFFLSAKRYARTDVSSVYASAPQEAGINARCELRGLWADGAYRICALNYVGDRVSMALSYLEVHVKSGSVVRAVQAASMTDEGSWAKQVVNRSALIGTSVAATT